MRIYHNASCTKSRETLELIKDKVKEIEIIEYLKNPMKFEELELILSKLSISPIDLVRKKEKIWKENFNNKKLNDNEIIQIMIDNPIIIERPIVINGMKAIIGRPPENVLDIMD